MKSKISALRRQLMDQHLENGVIEVRKLPVGTFVTLETQDEHFEMCVTTPKRGVVLVASDVRFWHREKMTVLGSVDPNSTIFLPEIIGEGLRVAFRPNRGSRFDTNPVISATVSDHNQSYLYKLWS